MVEITISKYLKEIMSDAYGSILGPSILKKQCEKLKIDPENIKREDLQKLSEQIFEVTRSFGEEKAREIREKIRGAYKISKEVLENKPVWQLLEANGDAQQEIREYSIAIGYYKKALSRLDPVEDPENYARICKKLGNAFNRVEDYQRSITYYDKAIEIYQKLNFSELASSLNGKANSIWRLGKHEEALEIAEDALKNAEKMPFSSKKEKRGKNIIRASIYTTIGNIYLDIVNKEGAIEYCNKAIRIYEDLQMLGRAGGVYNNLARVYEDFEEFEKAKDYYTKGIELCKKSGNFFMEGWARFNLASVYSELNMPKEALEECDRSMKIMNEFKNRLGKARVECMRGKAYKVMKDFERATEHFETSLKLLKGIQAVDYIEITLYEFARMYVDKGEKEKAIEKLEEAIKIHENRSETVTSRKIEILLERLKS